MHGHPSPESYVYVTDEGVTRHYADGSVQAIAWEDVTEVRVSTDVEGGPGRREVFFVLLDRRGQECVVPQSATDASFLAQLRHLPDFDLQALAVAVADVGDNGSVVWRTPEPLTPPTDLEFD